MSTARRIVLAPYLGLFGLDKRHHRFAPKRGKSDCSSPRVHDSSACLALRPPVCLNDATYIPCKGRVSTVQRCRVSLAAIALFFCRDADRTCAPKRQPRMQRSALKLTVALD